jgi:hypothetical protein
MENILNTKNQNRKRNREKIDPDRIVCRRLSAECPRDAFSCGYEHIDRFLRDSALENHDELRARTVTAHLDDEVHPVGFYAMTIGTEPGDEFADQPEQQSFLSRIKARIYRDQITTVQLLWVGVETSIQRCGVGTFLMAKAIDDFYEIVDRAGVAALTLCPIGQGAAKFYGTLGFEYYGSGNPKRMLLAAEAVIETRKRAGL